MTMFVGVPKGLATHPTPLPLRACYMFHNLEYFSIYFEILAASNALMYELAYFQHPIIDPKFNQKKKKIAKNEINEKSKKKKHLTHIYYVM